MKSTFPIVIIVLFFTSCRREEPTSWTVDVAVPIAHGHFNLDKLVPDSLLQADANGLWHLVISESLTDFSLDTIVAIPDTLIHKGFSPSFSGGPFPLAPGQDLITQDVNTELTLKDVELREVKIKSGFMEYSILSYTNAYLNCVYELPGVSLNGVPVVLTAETVPGTDANPSAVSGTIDLSGHRIDLTGSNGNLSNSVYSVASISISENQPGMASVYGDDSVAIELHFVDPRISYARGYFGQHEYDLDESTGFGDDINLPDGAINLDQVFFKMDIQNYTGADAQIDFDQMAAINSLSGVNLGLNYPDLFESINITRAFDNNGTVVPVLKQFELDNNNSNVDEFMEVLPDSIHLTGHVVINPLGDVSDGNDFIYTSKALNAVMELDVPLCVGMEGLILRDTLAITGDVDTQFNGALIVEVDNTFPFSAELNVSIVDELGNELAVIAGNSTIAPNLFPGIGQPAHSTIYLQIPSETTADIQPENRFVVSFKLETPSFDEPSKIYKDYYMDVKIRARAEIGVEVD